jgi:TAG lipase/lysophosphatidylethanolamine acyltransferase
MLLESFSALTGVLGLILTYIQRFLNWWSSKSPREVLLESLRESRIFEEWEAAAFQLDEVLGYDLW